MLISPVASALFTVSLGIRVLGSSIVGWEDHVPEKIDSVIDWAVSHNTDFHRFMLYTPIPGTPLYEERRKDGNLLLRDGSGIRIILPSGFVTATSGKPETLLQLLRGRYGR